MTASHLVCRQEFKCVVTLLTREREANLRPNSPCSSITICTVLLEYVFHIQSVWGKKTAGYGLSFRLSA